MNWREWPYGAEEYREDTGQLPDKKKCPVCQSALRPIETYYISRDFYDYEERLTAFYVAICPKCRTKYNRCAPIDEVTISPDAETITELEERVRTLEDTLSRLIAWIRTQQPQQQQQPKAIQAQQQVQERKKTESNDDAEDFKRRYRYLL